MVSNDDDERPVLEIPLSGRGVVPNLAITPGTIDIGRTGVGVPVTVPDLIEIVNMDDREIEVREIRLVRPNSGDGGGPFQIAGESSASIGARGSVEVGLEFAPETAGVHEVVVEIYTGSDPVRVATTRIRAEAVTVRLRGGGCRTTAGGGGASAVALALLALAGAGRVIRRRAPR